MKEEFNKLYWHDAELQSILIDRSDPGNSDQVVLVICWPNGIKSELVFHDCYQFRAQMNFGIIACETIMCANYINNSKELSDFRSFWKKMGGGDLTELGQYIIETNSTNSTLTQLLQLKKINYVKTTYYAL